MDRQGVDAAFREFFAARAGNVGRLTGCLMATAAADETLAHELRLIANRSAALLRIDMVFAIERRHFLTLGAGRKATVALLDSLHEPGTTDALVQP